MPLFKKSGQAFRRTIRRIVDAFRWNLGKIHIFNINASMKSETRNYHFELDSSEIDLDLTFSKYAVIEERIDTEVLEIDPVYDPAIVAETPPEQIEAQIEETVVSIDHGSIKNTSLEPFGTEVTDILVKGFSVEKLLQLRINPVDPAVKNYANKGINTVVRNNYDAAIAVPITRRSLSLLRLPTQERTGYWKEIITQLDKKITELDLLGIFPQIPLKGVTKAIIEPEQKQLKFWCSAKAIDSRKGILLIARDKNTGKVHQIFDRRSIK